MSGCGGCSFKGMSTAVEDTYVGVRFDEETNLTLCATGGLLYARGDRVVVELEAARRTAASSSCRCRSSSPARSRAREPILRLATRRRPRRLRAQDQERDPRPSGSPSEQARELGLEMKVSQVDFALSGAQRHLLLHRREPGRLPPARARAVAALLGARQDASSSARATRPGSRRHRRLRPHAVLLDLAQGLPADLDPDGEAPEPEPQPVEDLRAVRPPAVLPGLRGRDTTSTQTRESLLRARRRAPMPQ